METQKQHDDLQKTVLIPVLSLRSPDPAMPAHAAAFTPRATIPAPELPTVDASDAADIICDRVLQQMPATAMRENAILGAASRLMTVAGLLRSASAPVNSTYFSQLLIDAVRDFDRNLLHVQLRHDTALVARYILCCTVDESVLSTKWGVSSGWAHRSLLRLFHNEANGGDRFFALLEHAIQRQQECRDLLELFYLCLSLGFEGRLHLDPRGYDKIEALRMQLYRLLYQDKPCSLELATQWRPATSAQPIKIQKHWLRVLSIVAIAVSACGFLGLRLWLHVSADNVASAYENAFRNHFSGGS